MKHEQNDITITIYGAEEVCPSCVGAPGSKETYEWIQAAVNRKYDHPAIDYEYVDIDEPQEDQQHQQFIEKIYEEDMFYPIVFVNDDIVGEGIPRLKPIYNKLAENGLTAS